MMPPAMASDTSESCSHCRKVCPPNMNASRMTYAARHSRNTTRVRRAGATFESAATTIGTLPNGSMTRSSSTAAENISAIGMVAGG